MALDLECLTTEYFTGDGVKTAYNLSFDFIDVADINVAWYSSVGDEYTTVPSTDTTYGYQVDTGANGSFIRFYNPPANEQKFFVYRLTSIDPLKADFEAGHPIKAQDLDDNFKQLANAIEDTRCFVEGIVDRELITTEADDLYWKKVGETVYSNNQWTASDCYIASTKAIDQTFAKLVHMGIDPPPTPNRDGDLWWDTDDGNLYVYYSDTDSEQWVEANVTTGEAPSDGLIYGRKDGNWSVVPVWQTGYVSDVPSATGLSYFRTSGTVAGDYGTWTATNVYSNADATKLAGIEAGATADQTGAEIKTAYEAEADTNAFDDAAVTKLAGIATGAQVNDPNTVVDANYVATDENFTTADHTKLDGIETGAQVNAANTVIDANYVATDENFTTADHTKLDGIETGAQVNAANTVIDPNYVATDENFTTADHAKLDGIETAATADQTGAEIKALYEAEANAYTDAKDTKLSGIETGATADQTAAEILTAVKTVDGTGSGLDADLLDGQEGSYYLNYNNLTNTPGGSVTGFWSASGSDIFYSSGNVLIGSSTVQTHPNMDDLQLGDGSGNRGLTISSGSSSYGTLAFGDSTDASGNDRYSGSIEYYHADNSMRFYADIGERLRITSSGNVGIGSSSPQNRLTLASSGANPAYLHSVNASSGTGATDGVVIGLGSAADVYYWNYEAGAQVWATGGNERMRITSSGDVGIGTHSPGRTLHLHQDSSHSTQMLFTNSTTTSSASRGFEVGLGGNEHGQFWLYENQFIRFATNNTERLRIDSSGRLLVGSTSEYVSDANFQVTDDTNAKFVISNPGNATYSLAVGTDNALAFKDESNGVERMRIDISGNVSIGTSSPPSSAQLTVRGTNSEISAYSSAGGVSQLSLGDTNDHDDGFISYVNGSGFQQMRFNTAGAERMRIDSSGRLMMGTTTPGISDGDEITIATSGPCGMTIRSGSSSGGAIYFADADSGESGYVEYLHNVNALRFAANGSERMRIYADGGVSFKKYLEFANQADNGFSGYIGSAGLVINSGSGNDLGVRSGQHLVFATGGSTEKMRITSSGDTKFTGNLHSYENASGAIFQAVQPGVAYKDLTFRSNQFIVGTGAGSALTRMTITNTGNVGIGNSDPGTLLQVADNGDNGAIRVGGNNAGGTGLTLSYSNSGATTTTILQNYRSTNSDALLKFDAGYLTFHTGTSGDERMRINSLGDVIIHGDSSYGGYTKLQFASQRARIQAQLASSGGVPGASLQFLTMPTNGSIEERMRINSNGRVDIGDELGVAHAGEFQVINTSGAQQANDALAFFETNSPDWTIMTNYNAGGTHYHCRFLQQGSVKGSISGSSGSDVTYAGSSDYRLKENIVEITGTQGIDVCKKLKPSYYNWIDNRIQTGEINTVDGFIAHEVKEAGVLAAVTGEKDAVNDDGSIDAQMMDYGKLTPVLSAAIKGLIDKVETLEAKVAALEAG